MFLEIYYQSENQRYCTSIALVKTFNYCFCLLFTAAYSVHSHTCQKLNDIHRASFRNKIENVYCTVYILELLASSSNLEKLKNGLIIFLEVGGSFFWFYVITEDICNKFIEVNFCMGCMVSQPNRLLQDPKYTYRFK